MGEIKSTLDLVMERTKHLSMSSAEKEQQQSTEIEKKVKGLLQRATDGALEVDELFNALDRLQQSEGVKVKAILLDAVADRLDLDRDNSDLLTVLGSYCRTETAPIEKLLSDYRQARRREAGLWVAAATQALAEKHAISGSAVIPNLRSDPNWLAKLAAIKNDFQQRLNQEMDGLKKAG